MPSSNCVVSCTILQEFVFTCSTRKSIFMDRKKIKTVFISSSVYRISYNICIRQIKKKDEIPEGR